MKLLNITYQELPKKWVTIKLAWPKPRKIIVRKRARFISGTLAKQARRLK